MRRIITVTEINNYIKNILSADSLLSDVSVRGEVSNFKHHYTGHMYFTLKDEGGVIKCVMFKMNAYSLKFLPQDGMRVVVRGYVSVFEKAGQYQLYATEIIQDGAGELHMAFERLKKELQEKGMFDSRHKKQLPFLPSTVCVVTSSTGAVIRDIINVISRRFPNVHIRLVPTAVQGPDAPGEISRAVRLINEKKLGDVIIVARGGGSIEELWAFNERIVAESIFESVIPVVSAVGHETDFTIADFVADVRAPTPSAAAELVVPEKNMLMMDLDRMRKRLANALMKTLAEKKGMLERLKYSIVFRQPYNRIYQERMQLDILLKSLSSSMKAAVEKEKARFSVAVGRLDSINPLKTIARGFGAVNAAETGLFIKSVDEVKEGDDINVTLADGKLGCTVNGVEKRVWGGIHGKEQ
jgi:exodeoxyribonuclease VII large subunit